MIDAATLYAKYRVRGDITFLAILLALLVAIDVLLRPSADWWIVLLTDLLLLTGGFILRLVDRRRNPPVAWIARELWGLRTVAGSDMIMDGEWDLQWLDGYVIRRGRLVVDGTRVGLFDADGHPMPTRNA